MPWEDEKVSSTQPLRLLRLVKPFQSACACGDGVGLLGLGFLFPKVNLSSRSLSSLTFLPQVFLLTPFPRVYSAKADKIYGVSDGEI